MLGHSRYIQWIIRLSARVLIYRVQIKMSYELKAAMNNGGAQAKARRLVKSVR